MGLAQRVRLLRPLSFLEYIETITLTEEELSNLDTAPAIKNIEWLEHSPPCLEHLIAQGFPQGDAKLWAI